MQHPNNQYNASSIWTGIFIGLAGVLLLLSRITTVIPAWLVSWPAAIMALGVLIGIYTKFNPFVWLILVLWDGFLIVDKTMPRLNLHNYTGPVSIIFLGLCFIVARYMALHAKKISSKKGNFNVTNIFSHNKNSFGADGYNGGNIACITGSLELKLNNNFINDEAVVDITVFMGSVKLAIPPNWVIKNTVMTFIGSLSDQRTPPVAFAGITKKVIFKGSISMGVLEIVNEL